MQDLAEQLRKWQEREREIKRAACEAKGWKCGECDFPSCENYKGGGKK